MKIRAWLISQVNTMVFFTNNNGPNETASGYSK